MTLANLLETQPGRPLSDSQLRLTFTSVFKALQDIHAKGIIHRDIKPSAKH